jgi:serine/threonine protein phosphatase PrpC/CRP-like cAMP-binding protein
MRAVEALGLFIVCDGMGGQNAGEVASRMAIEAIRRVVSDGFAADEAAGAPAPGPERMAALLRAALETACAEVFDAAAADPSKTGMGTTCSALLVRGGKAVLGHVGDSRLYLCRGGNLLQLSEDHTWIAEAIKQGVFTPEEAASSPYRSVILRAIGKDRTVLVDTLVFDVVLGDTLLLCSDGFYQYAPDPGELSELLSAPDAEEIPARLIALANERGGSDNITTIVLRACETTANAAERGRSNEVLAGLGALRQIELMRDLTMAEVVKLKQAFQEASFPAGALVISEGEVSDNLFVIVQGTCEVLRAGHRIATLPAGAHFGEMALLSSRPRSASVRALEPCRMLAVDRTRLYAFLQQDAMLAAKFFWKLATTLSARLDEALVIQEKASGAHAVAAAAPH